MAEKKKAVAKVEEEIKDLSIFAVEEGQEEHLSQDELEMPFLRLAQKMTKQDIDGLKPGMFFNTVSEEVYGETLKVQVHGYFHNYTKWCGPKGNGEYRGAMSTEEFRTFEKENKLERDGGDLIHTVEGEDLRYTDTHNFIVSLPDHSEDGIMIYPLSSTGCKVARKWNTLNNSRRVNGRPTKRYATIWELKTAGFESNGFKYKQVSSIKPISWVGTELNEFGKSFEAFTESIKKQGVKYEDDAEHTESADESEF